MRTKEEVNFRTELLEWEETILELKDAELYIFAIVFNTFKYELRRFDYTYDFYKVADIVNCSKHIYKQSIDSLVDKNILIKENVFNYPKPTDKLIPNMPLIIEKLDNNKYNYLAEEEFYHKIELGNYSYNINLELLFYRKHFLAPVFDSYINVNIGVAKALDINGIDLIIVSDMLNNVRFGNSYELNEDILFLCGCNREELEEHMKDLCNSCIVYQGPDIINSQKITYHLNTELFDVINYTNYKEREESGTDKDIIKLKQFTEQFNQTTFK